MSEFTESYYCSVLRTVAKPVANVICREAKYHESIFKTCVYVGRTFHQLSTKMNIKLLGFKVIRVEQLPEEDALNKGVTLLSESFVFSVTVTIIIFEYSRAENNKSEAAIRESLTQAEDQKQINNRFQALEVQIQENCKRIDSIGGDVNTIKESLSRDSGRPGHPIKEKRPVSLFSWWQ